MRRLATVVPHLRARWPLVLLLASVGVMAIAVLDAWRVARSNRAVADQALREYSAFAAWSFAQHLEESLRTMAREAIGAVNHGAALHMSPQVPAARDLPHYLPWVDRCQCHRPRFGPIPETFFGFEIAHASLESAVNTHPDPAEGWEVDRPLQVPPPRTAFIGYTPADSVTVLRTVRDMAHEHPDDEHGYTYLLVPLQQGPRLLAYTLMPTVRGDTMVYGVQYRPSVLPLILRNVMDDSDLLPESFRAGRRNRDVIMVSVAAPDGWTIFTSDPAAPHDSGATVRLSLRFASLTVHTAIRPDQAGTLLVGGLPRSRVPFLLGLLALAASLSVVAVAQLRREDELARMRAEWIASVSHELRTPLAQIRLYQDTVRLGRASTPDRRAWALAQVDRETTRLSHLVEKVLSFSRLGRETGPAPPAQPCDLAAETRRIVEEFRPLVAGRRMTIDASVVPVPPLPLRRDALRHVLLNLLENAAKYGPDDQTIRVDLRPVDHEAWLSVTDEGHGVPAAERETVWRPFARGSAAADQGGSGIGLTIVRDIALQHGGRAWVEDAPRPGGGARFVVALPLNGAGT
jgi:signal transduction histidine kinase